MKGKVIIRGINDILGKNDIPWRFDEQEYNVDYRERNNCPEPTSSGPWDGNIIEKRIRRSGHRMDSLADLTGVDNDVVYDMAHIAFGHEINDVLWDLNKEL